MTDYENYTGKTQYEWPKQTVLKLIEIWSANECLYNPKHRFYNHKRVRFAVLKKIASRLQGSLPGIGPNDIKIKLNNLRSQYNRAVTNLAKNAHRYMRGSTAIRGPTGPYWFNRMHFLDGVIKSAKRDSLLAWDAQTSRMDYDSNDNNSMHSASMDNFEDTNSFTAEDFDAEYSNIVGEDDALEDRPEWPKEAVLELVDLYATHECLYNNKHSHYNHKGARLAALTDIAECLKPSISWVKPEDVRLKICNLRSQYSRAIMKKNSAKDANGSDEGDEPADPYWFDKMSFVQDFMNSRKSKTSQKKMNMEMFDNDSQQDYFMDNETSSTHNNMSSNQLDVEENSIADKFEWRRKNVLELVDLWANHKCLYDPNNSSYTDRNVRLDALNSIACNLSKSMPYIGAEDVLLKFNALRGQYCRAVSKKLKGYEPNAYWFEKMSFLESFLKPRKYKKELLNQTAASTLSPLELELEMESNAENEESEFLEHDIIEEVIDIADIKCSTEQNLDAVDHSLEHDVDNNLEKDVDNNLEKDEDNNLEKDVDLESLSEKHSAWPKNVVLDLIEYWSAHDCLYGPKNRLRRNRRSRVIAMKDITARLQSSMPGVKVYDVKNKIANLRGQHSRLVSRKMKGLQANAYWFDKLSLFLGDAKVPIKNDNAEVTTHKKPAMKYEINDGTDMDNTFEVNSSIHSESHESGSIEDNAFDPASLTMQNFSAAFNNSHVESFINHIRLDMTKVEDEELQDELQHRMLNLIYEYKAKQRALNADPLIARARR